MVYRITTVAWGDAISYLGGMTAPVAPLSQEESSPLPQAVTPTVISHHGDCLMCHSVGADGVAQPG